MDRWVGKNAVVTGAASGIGAAITQCLLQNRINVIGIDIQTDILKNITENNLKISGNGLFHGITCDISEAEKLKNTLEKIDLDFKGIHIMVNNAGVTSYSRIIDENITNYRKIININLLAVATCTSVAVKSMRIRGVEGHIFNINSIIGHEIPLHGLSDVEGSNGYSLYPASKHATVAMTHCVRRELAEEKLPIKITSISPGLVKTEITKGTGLANIFAEIPGLEPKDVAEALLYALGTRPEVQVSELTIRRRGEL